MADTIERLYKLTVDGAQAARQLGEIERATSNLDKRMAAGATALKAFAAAAAAAFSAGQVIAAIRRNIDAMDELAKSVQKVGIGAEDLQRLRYAADLSGVSAEQLDKAVGKLAVGMSDLAKGTDDTAKALRAIGAKSGEGPVETLKRIADQFEKMPDGIAKTNLAIQLFGKSGAELIPMLNAGGDALQNLANEADRFGGVISGKTLGQAEEFNDNMSRLERTFAGVVAQLTAGMLPALSAISKSLTDAASTGDGFVDAGEAIGEVLLFVAGTAIKATATLRAFLLTVKAVADIKQGDGDGLQIIKRLVADVNLIGANANLELAKLRLNYLLAKQAAATITGPKGTGPDPVEQARKAEEAAKAAKVAQDKAAKDIEKQEDARMARAKVLIDIAERQAEVDQQLGEQMRRYAKEAEDAAEATHQLIRSLDPATAAAEDFAEKLAVINELWVSGAVTDPAQLKRMFDELQKGWADSAGAMEKQKTELEVVGEGFNQFFENLSQGTADVEDLFKRMAQSIIAELLKIWAKKYIIEAVMSAFGGGGGAPVQLGGPGADGLGVQAFARGGIISRPIMFPMALAGEAGPEAILPLRRTASGDLGVQAQQAQMNVTVNNYGTSTVTTRQRGPNDLEVIVDQVKSSLAADVLRGGNDFARSAERAWGLNRGAGAAF